MDPRFYFLINDLHRQMTALQSLEPGTSCIVQGCHSLIIKKIGNYICLLLCPLFIHYYYAGSQYRPIWTLRETSPKPAIQENARIIVPTQSRRGGKPLFVAPPLLIIHFSLLRHEEVMCYLKKGFNKLLYDY